MPKLPPRADLDTHDVTNQPGKAPPHDLWARDLALQTYAKAHGADTSNLAQTGAIYADDVLHTAAADARRDPPRLVTYDAAGRRLDEVHFNTGYHQVMQVATKAGYANSAWLADSGGHATHAAHVYLLSQLEPGCCCPLTMTYAAQPVLAKDPPMAQMWSPKLQSAQYDPRVMPVNEKLGATLGMAMTEKQAGSDLRRTSSRAEPDDGLYRIFGHKWFCSAPMSDGLLTLAQAPGGLTCFLVPRWLDGERNDIHLQRLKNKLGNHANATAEIEFDDALAGKIGEEGEGIKTIMDMVQHSRLDASIAPAGLMRAALSEATHWAQSRRAFGHALIDQPLMQSVLADLALDAEGALALSMSMAAAFDRADDTSTSLARVGVALAKYLNNKRCVHVVSEAMEIMGGLGYIEDTALPMLYREAPLNGIWEGAGNVICLDVLRTLRKDPAAQAAIDAQLDGMKGRDRYFDAALGIHRKRWLTVPDEAEARWFTESLATLMTGASLLENAPNEIAEAYIGSRLSEHRGTTAGALGSFNTQAILARLTST